MQAKIIRQKYLDFFKDKQHAVIPSASLMPENDPTSLFIGSGMQPLIPYLMGEKHPQGTRLVNAQKSFRAEDIEEVGDNRHNTFFEMLGNWSLGDYFKKEQLNWVWEFLTNELKIDPNRLYVSVFRGNKEIGIDQDKESVETWKDIFKSAGIEAKDVDAPEEKGMQGGRIFYYPEKKNWWSRSGVPENMPIGEIGGPDSEIFYDLGEELGRHEKSPYKNEPCHINCDCGRFIEIGNSVFIEFIKTKEGFKPLPKQNVDFGGGLERIAMVAQGKDNVYETDLFFNILSKIEQLSGKKYRDNMKAFEVVADHIKAATFIIGDDKGIVPANTDQGYIVRRLIRRAIRYGAMLGIDLGELWTKEVAKMVVHDYLEFCPELRRNVNFITEEFDKEEKKFAKTIKEGEKRIEQLVSEGAVNFAGKEAFDLFQSYGFPIEMAIEELTKRGIKIDEKKLTKEFHDELKKHQELSRTAAQGKFKGGLADSSEETTKLHTTAHLLLAALRKVLGDHVNQAGSNITAERLRFDFTHPEKLTDEQKEMVEKLVNDAIASKLGVYCEEMSPEEAKAAGATGVFDAKYGDRVKVYKVGEDEKVFSYEICGGPHVDNIGKLGHFRIVKEASSSAGVRRIKAILEK